MEQYQSDLQDYHESFFCNNCENQKNRSFTYSRTVSNGEVWICGNCRSELLTEEEPNEDNY